jgi:ketosteroid isomerase-like protein
MLQRITAMALATALLAACGGGDEGMAGGAEAAASASADEQAIDDVRAYWETHYNMHHPDMVATTYADSAWLLRADGGYVEGRAAIQADLAEDMAESPTATITSTDVILMGDMASGMGTYEVALAPEGGASTSFGGTYLNILTKASGEWKILGGITNYDSARPDGWTWADPMTEPPTDEGTMTSVSDYYATHWNMGHASMVADTYTEDALESFSNGPILRGRAAIEAAIAERMASGTKLTIHDVATMPLADGWAADGGWVQGEAADGSGPVQMGTYLNIMKQQADGSWKIHRSVTTAQPWPSAM